MTARDVAELLGRAIAGSHWSVAKDSKSLITRNAATFRFVEEGKYRMVYGMACSPREGEPISGDTCTVQTGLPGQVIMSLSDGMGSGRSASEDSEKVIELTQRLLETGFSARSALKLVNTVLLLAGTEQNPATIDLCCIDLGTGVLEAMKLGAGADLYSGGVRGVEFSGSRRAADGNRTERGAGSDVAENVGRRKNHYDKRRYSRSDAGGTQGRDVHGICIKPFRRQPAGTGRTDPGVCVRAFGRGCGGYCTVLVGTVLERG